MPSPASSEASFILVGGESQVHDSVTPVPEKPEQITAQAEGVSLTVPSVPINFLRKYRDLAFRTPFILCIIRSWVCALVCS